MLNWQKKKITDSKYYQDKIYDLLNNQNYISRINKQITLDDGNNYTEFISCSYLGLDQDKRVIESASKNIEEVGFIFSSARTRMKYNNINILEDLLNQIFNGYVVLFSTTHLAHLGMIPLIASGEMPSIKIGDGGCVFLLDKTVHASIQINRGLMSQFGEVKVIDFNESELVEYHLKSINKNQTPLLFSDSIGSMGGKVDINHLVELVYRYKGYLYLDDAHGMSVYGKNGSGFVSQSLSYNCLERVIIATSFAKGFGTSGGAVVLSNKSDIKFIKEFCSTYMFSGSLVTPLINASIESAKIHLSNEILILQNALITNIQLFDKLILNKLRVVNFGLDSPIRGIFIGDEQNAIKFGLFMRQNKILVSVVTYPIRKKGEAILRILISANHTREDIKNICILINQLNI